MSDDTAAPEAPADDQGNPDAALSDPGKKALDAMKAERNEAKKQAADLKARLDRLEAANMSELERAQRDAEAARDQAKQATVSAFREAAVTFGGIPADRAELYLTANDVETLTKQALGLVEDQRAKQPAGPRPDLSQGSSSNMALNGDPLEQSVKTALGIR